MPVIAIFPGDRPYEPIVFRGGYTKTRVVDALSRAKSRTAADAAEQCLCGCGPAADE